MSFTLRQATEADAAAVSGLFARSFTATFGHLYPPHELTEFLDGCSEARFRHEATSPDTALMLGEADGRLLGYCALGPQDLGITSDRRWWVLRQLYLEDAAKGSGLGLALTEWALTESRARGMQDLYLTVWVDNHRARRFYDKLGFVEVGSYAFKVGNTVDDDRILKFTL